jgi:cell division protein FtsI/penicillin-binding protein 2
MDMGTLVDRINNTPAQYPIRVCDASEQESQRLRGLSSGLQWEQYNSRYYFDQGVASNVVGYTQLIGAETLDAYRRRGYQGSEIVARGSRDGRRIISPEHGGAVR